MLPPLIRHPPAPRDTLDAKHLHSQVHRILDEGLVRDPAPLLQVSAADVLQQSLSHVFVINRPKDTARLSAFARQAAKVHISFNVSAAVDKDTLDVDALLRSGTITKQLRDTVEANQNDRKKKMSALAIAAGLSHALLWRQLVLSKVPYALVLEDDVFIPKALNATLARVLPNAPSDFDVLRLSHDRLVGRVVNRDWLQPLALSKSGLRFGFNGQTRARGYIMSQRGAQRLQRLTLPYNFTSMADDEQKGLFNEQTRTYFSIDGIVRSRLGGNRAEGVAANPSPKSKAAGKAKAGKAKGWPGKAKSLPGKAKGLLGKAKGLPGKVNAPGKAKGGKSKPSAIASLG